MLEMNSKVNEAMEFTAWCKCAETVEGFLAMLAEHSNVILSLLINEEEENLSVRVSSIPQLPIFMHVLS